MTKWLTREPQVCYNRGDRDPAGQEPAGREVLLVANLRRCTRCLEVKSEGEFYLRKDAAEPGARLSRCKECMREQAFLIRAERVMTLPHDPAWQEKFFALRARDEQLRLRRQEQRRENAFIFAGALQKRVIDHVIKQEEDEEREEAVLIHNLDVKMTDGAFKSNPNWLCVRGQRRWPSRVLEEELQRFFAEFDLEYVSS